MLANLIERVREKVAASQLEKMPVVQLGTKAIKQYWLDNEDISGGFSAEYRRWEAEQMMDEVIRIAMSSDPVLENRRRLAAQVFSYARFLALALDPSPAVDPNGLRGQPGITGELKAHLRELADKDEALSEFMHGFDPPESQEEIVSIVEARLRVLYAWAHVFQVLRVELKDVNQASGKDWFRPFVAVMVAWHEHQLRRSIGLSHSLPGTSSAADAASIGLSGFMECVKSTARYPDLEWRRRLKAIGEQDNPALQF